jgi:hypothetical protein
MTDVNGFEPIPAGQRPVTSTVMNLPARPTDRAARRSVPTVSGTSRERVSALWAPKQERL